MNRRFTFFYFDLATKNGSFNIRLHKFVCRGYREFLLSGRSLLSYDLYRILNLNDVIH